MTALGAVSRKVLGVDGSSDVDLPLTGTAGLECRSGGATNDHQIVVKFGSSVTFNNAALTSGTGSVSGTTGSGSTQPVINLTGITNAQALAVTLFGVNDGTNVTDIQVPMRVLLGAITGNGMVNASDVGQVKANSGQTTGAANFRSDVTVSGGINSSDIGVVNSQSGTALP